MNSSDARPIVTGIENIIKQQRKRFDSVPIITGIGAEISRDDEESIEKELNSIPVVAVEIELPKDKDDRKRRRSKISESDIRKMEVFKGINGEDEEVVIETRVISGLIENIEEENVRSLIECFNPILRGSPELIKQQMLQCSEKWKNRKDIYIGAINYIEHGRTDARDKKEQLIDSGVERLCEVLIREIENRMPNLCKRCEDWYIVKLNDMPEIHCMWCKVGMHDCIEINEVVKSSGFKWLCGKCDPIFTEHFLPKLDQTALFDGFEEDMRKKNGKGNERKNETKVNGNNKINEEQESSTRQEVTVDVEVIVMEDTSEEEEKKSDGNNNQNVMENEESRKKEDENRSNNQNKREETTVKEICWFFKNKKCRYTTNCKNEHPEQCKAKLETGICEDGDCKLLHPKICRNQFYRGYCPRGDTCWFTHPTNCRNNQQNSNSYNNNNNNHNNHNFNSNSQYQNTNNNQMNNTHNVNNNRNMNANFLETWPTLGNFNNRNPGTNQMQPMMQMMQTMMERISRMDNKLVNLEMGRQMYR